MPRLQFGLRLLLALPVCLAAFYLGWSMRESRMQALQDRDRAVAEQLRVAIQNEMVIQRSIRAATLHDSLDGAEHRRRMESYKRQLQDPINARMFPNGAF